MYALTSINICTMCIKTSSFICILCIKTKQIHQFPVQTGHLAGLAVGAYLGWGLSPNHVQILASSALKDTGSRQPDKAQGALSEEDTIDVEDVMHVDHSGALRRWAGYVSFAATLGLMVAGTVVARTGELPDPKGIELLGF